MVLLQYLLSNALFTARKRLLCCYITYCMCYVNCSYLTFETKEFYSYILSVSRPYPFVSNGIVLYNG